jgi:sugar-specific transcriptional regulator TrmB
VRIKKNMNLHVLENLGLSKGEIKVYTSLLKLNEATITPIVKESQVTKSKIYDILDRLIEKGLVGYIVKNNVKHFIVNSPHSILDYIERKEAEIETTKKEVKELIPQLMSASMQSTGRVAEIYEGYQGIRSIREELLATFKEGDTLRVLGAPKIANEKWEGWLLEFHKKRIENKIKMNIIYEEDAKKYGAIRKKMVLTEVKYLKNASASLNWIDVFPDAVFFGMVLERPIAFVVRDKSLVKSFKNYFDIMWAGAK